MPMNRGKEKEDVVHIYKGKLAIKSTETPSFAEVWKELGHTGFVSTKVHKAPHSVGPSKDRKKRQVGWCKELKTETTIILQVTIRIQVF